LHRRWRAACLQLPSLTGSIPFWGMVGQQCEAYGRVCEGV
jgi:hypothetical protein